MKKINFVLLFVAIVSSNAFGHDTTFVTYGRSLCKENVKGEYYEKSKITPRVNAVTVTNDYIKVRSFGDQLDDSLYVIIDNCGEMQTKSGKKMQYFKCKDLQGIICYISIMTKNYIDDSARIEIQYSNGNIIYFLQ